MKNISIFHLKKEKRNTLSFCQEWGGCISETACEEPCQNGGICEYKEDGFACKCMPGWTGPSCREDVNAIYRIPALFSNDWIRPNTTGICKLDVDTGLESCSDNLGRWHYDSKLGSCTAFIYSGCGGNRNRFKNFETCMGFCKGSPCQGFECPAGTTCQVRLF